MKQLAGGALEFLDQAIRLALIQSARKVAFVIGEIVANVEIQVAIVVIVKKSSARSP